MENRFLQLVPLVVFTIMAIVAAGLMTGAAWILLAGIYLPGIGRYLLIPFVLAGVGIVISLLHLGRIERFLRAMVGVRHSWLSREVILAGVFTVLSGAVFILAKTGQGSILIDFAAFAAFIAALIMTRSIGMVYHLPGRFTWEGLPNSLAPLVTALLLGAYLFIFLNTKPRPWYDLLFFMMWLVDFLLALSRAINFRKFMGNRYGFVFPRLIFATRAGHMARLVLSFCLMLADLFTWDGLVLSMIIGNIVLDRYCFYAGTMEVSPKSEIASRKAERMKESES